MHGTQKRNRVNAENLGLWETCEAGVFATPHGICRICGDGRTAHEKRVLQAAADLSAGRENPVRQPNQGATLVTADCTQTVVPNSNAKYIVVLSRGYSGIPLDRDNLGSGFKALRDAIAKELLGSESDAERHGFQWEHRQFRGKGTKVQIYKRIEIQEVTK